MNDAKLERVMNAGTSGLQPVNTVGVVKLSPPQLAMAEPTSPFSTSYNPRCSSLQVTMKEEYLINTIELEGFSNQPVNPIGHVTYNTDEVPMVSTNT